MSVSPLKLVATGTISLALLSSTAGCGGVSPTEGSGEVREQQEVPNGLADEIEQRIDDRLSGDGGAAPLSQIDDFENVSADTIRVLVQATLSPSDREELASALFAESGTDALSTVLVVDGTGEESEHRQ